ncbi:MAG TPA: hypothetical protein VHU24_07500 [Solirubrobacterales bacterium]|nr:hypothetical protein [Solirubrobacterales bacterium]
MREHRPQIPLVFTHIPKTAGTSLREAVVASLKPEVVFNGFGRAALGSFSDVDSLHPSIRRLIALDPAELPADAQFISGHIAPSETRARFPEADHFTVLREPRVRLVSNWLFARAHSDFNLRRWGGLATWMRAARSDLSDYIDNPHVAAHVDNVSVRFLLWPHDLIPSDDFIDPIHDDELFDQAVAMLDTYAYAGIVEDPDYVTDLGEWLGRPLTLERLQQVSGLPQPDSPDLAAEVAGGGADLLRWRTRIDARLWSHLAARAFPADELEEVRERAYQDAVGRYSILVTRPVRQSYPRRILEGSYSLATRLRAHGGRAETGSPRAS